MAEENWAKAVLALPFDEAPGTHFVYSNVGPYLAGLAVQKRARCDLVDYLMPRLFAPLGIQRTVWEVDPLGRTFGAAGLLLALPELHKLGLLYQQGGQWQGKQLLDPNWVRESRRKQVENEGRRLRLPVLARKVRFVPRGRAVWAVQRHSAGAGGSHHLHGGKPESEAAAGNALGCHRITIITGEDTRMYTPDLLTMTDGTPVTSSAQWEARRGELLNILAREQYGTFLPPSTASAQVMAPPMPVCAGHAMQETLEVRFDTPAGEFAFPLRFLYPADGQVHPLFLLLNFRPLIPDIYCPAEEILDNGFALAVVCYTDITADDGDWGSGLCGHYPRKHPDTDPGKLVFWAYAASRALDVLTLRPEVDARNIAVIGHSRLGKAALLCGAQDTRIRFTCANDAGCGGDALEQTKHPGAEDYAAMARSFPYWFCGNRSRYIDHPEERPYDQHFLLGAIAPRFAAVSSASLDRWADPYSQQLCCAAASPAWKLHGLRGFVGTESPAAVGAAYPEGHVAYHLRGGLHYLSRQDWLFYMDFVRRHKGETV